METNQAHNFLPESITILLQPNHNLIVPKLISNKNKEKYYIRFPPNLFLLFWTVWIIHKHRFLFVLLFYSSRHSDRYRVIILPSIIRGRYPEKGCLLGLHCPFLFFRLEGGIRVNEFESKVKIHEVEKEMW